MTGDLRSSILTTAAVAASVAGLTVIQPLTAAPPLLLAALLMDRDSADGDGVRGVADTIQGKLLPGNSKTVLVNFLTGPFGIWSALGKAEDPQDLVPSTTFGTASGMPFIGPKQVVGPPPTQYVPPVAPGQSGQPPLWPLEPILAPIFAPVVGIQPPDVTLDGTLLNPMPLPGFQTGPVVTSYQYDMSEYALTSLLNPFALTNAVAAYLDRALSGNSIAPVNPDGSLVCGRASSCFIDGREIKQETKDGVTTITFTDSKGRVVTAIVQTGADGRTYVTYQDNGPLPLIRPLRDYGGLLGNELADVLEPALTALVYWGYRDAVGTGGSLLPTPAQTIRTILDFLVGVKQGLESLTKPHTPTATPTTALARAVPADAIADPQAGADEAALDPAPPPTEGSWAPPHPVAISVEDALNRLAKAFQQQPAAAPDPIADIPAPDVPVVDPVDPAPVDPVVVDPTPDVPVDVDPVDVDPVDETPTSNGPSSGETDSDRDTKAGTGKGKGDSRDRDRSTHGGQAGKSKGDTTPRDKTSRDRSGNGSAPSSRPGD